MWRVTMFFKGATDLTAAQVFEGLLNEHAPLLLANDSLTGRHLRKIVIAAASDPAGSGLPDTFDASGEFWFDDEKAAGSGLALLTRDEELTRSAARYVATDQTVAWMGEYVPNLQQDGVNFKVTVSGDVADGRSVSDALQYWGDVHPV